MSFLCGCIGSDDSDADVAFQVGCESVTCHNANETNFPPDGFYPVGSYMEMTCVWYCARYKDDSKVKVTLTFGRLFHKDSCWQWVSEEVSDAICE